MTKEGGQRHDVAGAEVTIQLITDRNATRAATVFGGTKLFHCVHSHARVVWWPYIQQRDRNTVTLI